MTIKEFIQDFKAKKIVNNQINPTAIEDYIRKTLEVREYVPFAEKQAVAQIVLTTCSNIEDGVVVIDSVQKYILFTISMISTYTNLEIDEDIDSYDLLCSTLIGDETLLDCILKTFEKEYGRCLNILNMMTTDLLAENNIEKQVGRFLTGILSKVDILGEKLSSNLGEIPEKLSQLDIDKLTDLIGEIKN